MKTILKKVGKVAFEAQTDSGHTFVMDGSPDDGGENKGARPMETVLMSLGGCSGIDVSLILEKSRQQVSDCVIEIEATRADAVPAVFTDIHLHYIVTGSGLDHDKVGRAVKLSMEKYCSVTKMLEPTVNITSAFSVVEQ